MVLVQSFHVLVRVGRVARLIGTIGALVAWLLPVAGADYVPLQMDFRRVIVRTVQTLIRFCVPRAVAVPFVVVPCNRSEHSCFYSSVASWGRLVVLNYLPPGGRGKRMRIGSTKQGWLPLVSLIRSNPLRGVFDDSKRGSEYEYRTVFAPNYTEVWKKYEF